MGLGDFAGSVCRKAFESADRPTVHRGNRPGAPSARWPVWRAECGGESVGHERRFLERDPRLLTSLARCVFAIGCPPGLDRAHDATCMPEERRRISRTWRTSGLSSVRRRTHIVRMRTLLETLPCFSGREAGSTPNSFRPIWTSLRVGARLADTEHLAADVVVSGALRSAQRPSLDWSG